MYQALYRTCRPEVFEELLGQEHIVKILTNQIKNDQVGHAYLFCGTRGTGKTTVARLLAKGVNCLSEGTRPCGECENCRAIKEGNFIDVIEIDAASNNSVDNIRELKESVKYPPAKGRKKVYIIDEVHMLSPSAFNALLKTLEEPPEYVMFILATTEPQVILQTILSRCMRLDFRRVPESLLKEGMEKICNERNVEISKSALGILAANADGSVRDCLSLLDQCLAAKQNNIDREDVLDVLGTSGEEVFIEMTHLVSLHKASEALLMLNDILADGKEIRQLMKDWMAHYRNLLISKFVRSPEDMLNMSTENVNRLKSQANSLELEEINRAIMEISKTISAAKYSTQPRILMELAIVKLASVYEPAHQVPYKPAEPKRAAQGRTAQRPAAPPTEAAPAAVPEAPDTSATPAEEPQIAAQTDIETATAIPEEQIPRNFAEEAVSATPAPAADENYNLEDLWYSIFDDDEASRGTFFLMKEGARPVDSSNGTLTLGVSNVLMEKIVNDNKVIIEDMLERRCGQRILIEVEVSSGKTELDKETRLKKAASEASDKLGLNIEYK